MERPFLFIEGTALNAFIFTEIISKIKVILPDAISLGIRALHTEV